MNPDPRVVLERLCAERGEDFAGLSRMLGRNPAYIQQFVRRGVPKRLREEERRKLAPLRQGRRQLDAATGAETGVLGIRPAAARAGGHGTRV